jgi:hypothetical protein
MAKATFKKDRRDPGRFIQVPLSVLDSTAYKSLSAHEVKLLWDIAAQYAGMNNGRLLAGWKFMNESRGWKSPDTLNKARAALLDRCLIFRTRQGRMPNLSSWYACCWWPLDHDPTMDVGPQSMPRGDYTRWYPE